jgi:hypothetical protein
LSNLLIISSHDLQNIGINICQKIRRVVTFFEFTTVIHILMRVVGSWSNAVTKNDYVWDLLSWSYSNVIVLNDNINIIHYWLEDIAKFEG